MANREHLKILKQGVDAWNRWREENPEIVPDLNGTDLSEAELSRTDLHYTNLSKAKLMDAKLIEADLSGATLIDADLFRANLTGANLSHAILHRTYLTKANLVRANLSRAELYYASLLEANLSGAELSEAGFFNANLWDTNLSMANLCNANLRHAQLINTNFEMANLTGCLIYGISTWDLNLKGAKQSDLVITPPREPEITVDNLEVAQFIYLLLYNEKIRHVIDTITSKVVLILGSFKPPERKAVLDAIKEELRKRDYLPVMFDFKPPRSRDVEETITILARLSRFIIADITEPAGSVAHELRAIVPDLESVPVQPILQTSAKEYGMFKSYKRKGHVLEIYRYDNRKALLASFEKGVIIPAETKVKELRNK